MRLQDYKVKSVTFKCSRPDGQYGLHKIAETTFGLGLGPCGRWVTAIEATVTESLLKVVQFSTESDTSEVAREMAESADFVFIDHRRPWRKREPLPAGLKEWHKERYLRCQNILQRSRDSTEIKEFIYKLSDVHGRIVIIK